MASSTKSCPFLTWVIFGFCTADCSLFKSSFLFWLNSVFLIPLWFLSASSLSSSASGCVPGVRPTFRFSAHSAHFPGVVSSIESAALSSPSFFPEPQPPSSALNDTTLNSTRDPSNSVYPKLTSSSSPPCFFRVPYLGEWHISPKLPKPRVWAVFLMLSSPLPPNIKLTANFFSDYLFLNLSDFSFLSRSIITALNILLATNSVFTYIDLFHLNITPWAKNYYA